jgi:hypothetical protein
MGVSQGKQAVDEILHHACDIVDIEGRCENGDVAPKIDFEELGHPIFLNADTRRNGPAGETSPAMADFPVGQKDIPSLSAFLSCAAEEFRNKNMRVAPASSRASVESSDLHGDF